MTDTEKRTHRSTRTMGADADIVLNTAADPTRAAAWLTTAAQSDDTVELAWTPGAPTSRYRITADPEAHEVHWRPTGAAGSPARLRVVDRGAGSSAAELRVETTAGTADDQPDSLTAALDRALAGLASEVEQNFTAG